MVTVKAPVAAVGPPPGPVELIEQRAPPVKAVERQVGRAAGGPRHGPRVIDVDLLLLSDITHSSERLTLPHSETGSRRFVLVPLLELDPDLTLPSGQRLADTLERLGPGQSVSRVAPPLM